MGEHVIHLQLCLADLEYTEEAISNNSLFLLKGWVLGLGGGGGGETRVSNAEFN